MIQQIEPPFIDLFAATWTDPQSYELAADAKRFENWERNIAGQVGLMRAVRYARSLGLPAIEARVTALAASLRDALRDIPGVTVHDQGARKCGITTFTKSGLTPGQITAALSAQGINTSVSLLTSARLDMEPRGLIDGLTRASVHYYNSEEEITRFITAIAAL